MITDPVTGEVNHRLHIDGGVFGAWGKFRLEAIDLEMGHAFERNYRIHPDEPNSARATMTQSYEMARGDWQVKIKAGAEMTSTAQTFELDGMARGTRRRYSGLPSRLAVEHSAKAGIADGQ